MQCPKSGSDQFLRGFKSNLVKESISMVETMLYSTPKKYHWFETALCHQAVSLKLLFYLLSVRQELFFYNSCNITKQTINEGGVAETFDDIEYKVTLP